MHTCTDIHNTYTLTCTHRCISFSSFFQSYSGSQFLHSPGQVTGSESREKSGREPVFTRVCFVPDIVEVHGMRCLTNPYSHSRFVGKDMKNRERNFLMAAKLGIDESEILTLVCSSSKP